MNSIEIRGAFQKIAEYYAKNEEERAIIYQFLNQLTCSNTDGEIEVILKLLNKKI